MRISRRMRKLRYACLRQGAFEVRKAGALRFDLRDPYHLAVALPWPAFVACGIAGMVLINLIFAGLYCLQPGAIQNLPPGDFYRAFFYSLETLSTVGYGEMSPLSRYGYAVAGIEMAVGMAFVALLTGILFVRFSRPQAGILFADKAVVTTYKGNPALMVRVANGRVNMLIGATAQLSVLLKETDDQGRLYRRFQDLPLLSPHLPAFPMTWTLMHPIDETSPLHGCGPAELKAAWARLFLSVTATDVKLGRQVQDVGDYTDRQILFGAHYADAVTYDEDGTPTADLSQLSHVEFPLGDQTKR
ncbi:MAG TPA: ion channel [Acetobacteraceae bacterium]|nr:ion channel [Acetobacteraceae bacterium]